MVVFLFIDSGELSNVMSVAQRMRAVILRVGRPIVMGRVAFQVEQNSDTLASFGPAPFMGVVAAQSLCAAFVQPVQRGVDVQLGLIKVHNLLSDQFLPDLFHDPLNMSRATPIYAGQRNGAQRHGKQIIKRLAGSIVKEKPFVLQIQHEGLQPCAILCPASHPFAEPTDKKLSPARPAPDPGTVFSHLYDDGRNVEHLPLGCLFLLNLRASPSLKGGLLHARLSLEFLTSNASTPAVSFALRFNNYAMESCRPSSRHSMKDTTSSTSSL
jgi:hypothetical protein